MEGIWTPIIAVHAVAASLSLLFGAFQLLRRAKGDALHKVIGRVWVGAMYVVIFTSFGVQTLNGGFSWLHALSALTLVTVTVGLWAAVKGYIRSHKSYMMGSYFGILGAFGGVVAVPSRRIPQMAMYDLPTLIMWVAGLAVTMFAVIGATQLLQQRTASKDAENNELERLQSECEAALKRKHGVDHSEAYLNEVIIVRNLVAEDRDLTTLRVMAKFCERNSAIHIRSVVGVLRKSAAGRAEMNRLTDEHFQIHVALMNACVLRVYDSNDGTEVSYGTKARHFKALVQYALMHVEDGWLIASIVEDRDIIDYDEIFAILAEMKSNGNTALSEGVL